jgi:ribosome biogenesis GTPase A
VFCFLDRNPRYYEQHRFKSLKKDLADYRDRCLEEGDGAIPPWLEGLELQASGVKAFRILVCGKTGVGKSTLINKVFGVEMVVHFFEQSSFSSLTRLLDRRVRDLQAR